MLVQRPDGTVAPEFQKTVRATGILMKLQPRVSADRKYIQLALSYEISRETAGAKEYRVTITPVGGQDDGRSRTETLRQPALHVHQIETTFSFPLNRAALVHCDGHVFLVVPSLVEPGTKEQPVPSPLAPCVPATPAQPAACPVPTVTPFTMAPAAPWPVPPAPIYYRAAVPVPTPMLPPQVRPVFEEQVAPPTQTPPADEKFRRVKKAVTAFQVQPPQMPPADVLRLRVLMDQSEELRQVRNAMLSALLAEYRAACAAGDTAAAAKLAARCLAIDPTCFGK
jgi:hypothetical protein